MCFIHTESKKVPLDLVSRPYSFKSLCFPLCNVCVWREPVPLIHVPLILVDVSTAGSFLAQRTTRIYTCKENYLLTLQNEFLMEGLEDSNGRNGKKKMKMYSVRHQNITYK